MRLLRLLVVVALVVVPLRTAAGQQVEAETFTLDNGMKFLLVRRTEQPNNIAAGWVAKVGSVNERPGITGISHFFEHMMFKGTNTIGTNDAKRDAELRKKQQEVHEKILNLVWTEQYRRHRAGEIDDPWNPTNDTDELRTLRAELKRLMAVQQGTVHTEQISKLQSELAKLKEQSPNDVTKIEAIEADIKRLDNEQRAQSTIVKNEFDSIYTKLGGSGMNAFTANDLTFYFINVPSNKFELWAWMESDRLADSVFREFYSERDVVHEERRLRTESTPTGVFEEQFDAMFWQSSPYSWPVIGWTSDLNSYTREEAERYFNIYYRPNNLVGVIVGDFDPAKIKPVIQEYFGRLQRGPTPPAPVVTLEMAQTAEQRMTGEADVQPQIEIRYHTVPWNHADSFALEMMSQLLNDRTGRLYKSLVEGQKIASSATTASLPFTAPAKYAGFFSFTAEVKGDAMPGDLERGWYVELARLQNELVGEKELQKVRNRVAANAFRRLQSNFFLLVQLGYYESLGGWEYINESTAKLQAVTAEDIQRVARKYFAETNRSVGVYLRKVGAEEVDPELAGMDPQQRAGIKQMLGQFNRLELSELQLMVARLQMQEGKVPPEHAAAFQYVVKKAKERVAELQAQQPK